MRVARKTTAAAAAHSARSTAPRGGHASGFDEDPRERDQHPRGGHPGQPSSGRPRKNSACCHRRQHQQGRVQQQRCGRKTRWTEASRQQDGEKSGGNRAGRRAPRIHMRQQTGCGADRGTRQEVDGKEQGLPEPVLRAESPRPPSKHRIQNHTGVLSESVDQARKSAADCRRGDVVHEGGVGWEGGSSQRVTPFC